MADTPGERWENRHGHLEGLNRTQPRRHNPVEGAAMANDIEEVKARLNAAYPMVGIQQLVGTHPGDDIGLWFFRATGIEVQLESTTGNCPFLVETDAHGRRAWARSVEEAIELIESELHLR